MLWEADAKKCGKGGFITLESIDYRGLAVRGGGWEGADRERRQAANK